MEKIGIVTENEKKEIQILFERTLALNELILSIQDQELDEPYRNHLLTKINSDFARTTQLFDNWWREKAVKYNWNSVKEGKWEIDFITNEIFLVVKL